MQTIDININKAKIENFTVKLKDDMPEVDATIGLYAGEKRISSFSLSSEPWGSMVKMEIPLAMIEPIKKIAAELEEILTLECKSAMKLIPMQTKAAAE